MNLNSIVKLYFKSEFSKHTFRAEDNLYNIY